MQVIVKELKVFSKMIGSIEGIISCWTLPKCFAVMLFEEHHFLHEVTLSSVNLKCHIKECKRPFRILWWI